MRFRIWTESFARVIPINGEPLATQRGDVVIVAVVESYERASEVMRALSGSIPNTSPKALP